MEFGGALESGMDAASIHMPLGLAYFKNANFSEAAAEFSRALDLDPANDQALFLRGMALFNNEEPERALEDFNAIVRLDPSRGRIFVARSLVLQAMGRQAEAERDLQSAIELGEVEAELFIREYCLTLPLRGLAMSLFDAHRAGWGRELRGGATNATH